MTRFLAKILLILALVIGQVSVSTNATFAQFAGGPRKPPPPRVTPPKVPSPLGGIRITPPKSTKKPPVVAKQPTEPTPQAEPPAKEQPVIYRDVPLPKSKPLLSLGRAALLDAPRAPNMIAVLVQTSDSLEPAEGLSDDFDVELVSKLHINMLGADLILLRAASDDAVNELVALLSKDARVLGVQPNYLFELQQDSTQSPAMFDLQYAPQKMSIGPAHLDGRGENAIVAVIDTSVDLQHNVFSNANITSFDAIELPGAENEKHGTAIAGLIGANKDLLGIAPRANILAVRAFAQTAEGKFMSDSFTIARAIDWAVSANAQVLNMSFAGPGDPLILKMMDVLATRNVLVVAAAGNNGIGAPAAYPAAHPHTIAVTATDVGDALYTNANRGSYITISAPGVDVIAPAPGNNYEVISGTSIATAHMTGIVALMLSKKPDLTATQLLDLLQETSADVGARGLDPEFGLGLVNASAITSRL